MLYWYSLNNPPCRTAPITTPITLSATVSRIGIFLRSPSTIRTVHRASSFLITKTPLGSEFHTIPSHFPCHSNTSNVSPIHITQQASQIFFFNSLSQYGHFMLPFHVSLSAFPLARRANDSPAWFSCLSAFLHSGPCHRTRHTDNKPNRNRSHRLPQCRDNTGTSFSFRPPSRYQQQTVGHFNPIVYPQLSHTNSSRCDKDPAPPPHDVTPLAFC